VAPAGRRLRICTLGDLLLDVVVRLDGPLARGADVTATTRLLPGGQAANVAAWAAELGADARFVGKRADDEAGRLAVAGLEARGVDVVGPIVGGTNGVVVSLVDEDGERTMASDRGVAPLLRAEELDLRWLEGCDWLHLAGYSLLRPPIDLAGAKAAGGARALGIRISVDLSAWTAIRDFGPHRFRARLADLAPDLIFATEREREELGGALPAPSWVLKRGAAGCVVSLDGERTELPALPAEAVDATGAGDALAAGFLVGGPGLALEAAARCVSQVGAMP
jgi:sugar/nucleoside kinase (ribokinase family)